MKQLKWSLDMLKEEPNEDDVSDASFQLFTSETSGPLSKRQNETNGKQYPKNELISSIGVANFDGVFHPERITLEFVEKEKKNPLVEPKRFVDTFKKYCLYSLETCI